MQKALIQMNLPLPLVIRDIAGVTGLRILRDIVAGQRVPEHLAQHRAPRCRASKAEIIAALTATIGRNISLSCRRICNCSIPARRSWPPALA